MISRLDGTYCCPACGEEPVKGFSTSSCEFCGFIEYIMGEDGYYVKIYDHTIKLNKQTTQL